MSMTMTAEAIPIEPFEGKKISNATWGEADDHVVELPVIQLTDLNKEDIRAVARITDEDGSSIMVDSSTEEKSMPVAAPVDEYRVATFWGDAVETQDWFSTRSFGYSEVARAEYISVTFYKEQKGPLGINLLRDEPRIFSITEGSIATDSPFRPGDQILSVNGIACSSPFLTSRQVASILCDSVGDVTLVVHNEGGASDLVESMIVKSDCNDALGISIASKPNGHGTAVHCISEWSKFNSSLLNSGDTVLSVNGTTVTNITSTAVLAELTKKVQKITILARTSQEVGVVVAQLPMPFVPATTSKARTTRRATAKTAHRHSFVTPQAVAVQTSCQCSIM